MRNAYEVLHQKETDLARVRREIESLRIVAPLLSDELLSEELTKKRAQISRGNTGAQFQDADELLPEAASLRAPTALNFSTAS